jgi:hypothetical protein
MTNHEQPLRFRPTGRRRNRIAAGVALAALAIGGNIYVYSTLDDATPVVQVIRDVPAGTQLSADMLRTVAADVDATVNVITGDRLDSLVGSYAKVRLVSGALVTSEALQTGPLVSPGNSIVAVQLPDGSLPAGTRERAPIQLVIPPASTSDPSSTAPTVIEGRVVGLPVETASALGELSLSVEIASDDAPTLAAADVVRIVLNEPAVDPAAAPDEDGAS